MATKRTSLVAALGAALLFPVGMATAADAPAAAAPPTEAKICLNCHKTEPGNLRGHWEGVAMKAHSLQLKIDDRSEVIKFNKKGLKVLHAAEKGDLEKMLRGIKKGHEVRVQYKVVGGAKVASVVSIKPPVKISEAERATFEQVEALVAQGPEKGAYTLIDSRPGPKFKEGSIPTAISLPFPAFDANVDKLPADKARLLIFFCSGETCNMSPGSLQKAKKLGYTNAKVFVQGMPGWLSKRPGLVAAANVKDAWKDIPYVLLDARPAAEAEKAFIQGALGFAAADEKALEGLPKKEAKAPLFVYDQDGKGAAAEVAQAVIKAGWGNVQVVAGGFEGLKAAGLPVETGKLAAKSTWAPKARPGELPDAEFAKLIEAIPADTVVVDVRTPEEFKEASIKGAVNIPADELDQRSGELPAAKRIVTHCSTGTRAEMAYVTLKGKGFTNVAFVNAKVAFADGKVQVTR